MLTQQLHIAWWLTVCVIDYETNCAITVLHIPNNLTEVWRLLCATAELLFSCLVFNQSSSSANGLDSDPQQFVDLRVLNRRCTDCCGSKSPVQTPLFSKQSLTASNQSQSVINSSSISPSLNCTIPHSVAQFIAENIPHFHPRFTAIDRISSKYTWLMVWHICTGQWILYWRTC